MKKKNKKQKGFPSMLKMEIPILKIKILKKYLLFYIGPAWLERKGIKIRFSHRGYFESYLLNYLTAKKISNKNLKFLSYRFYNYLGRIQRP